MKKLNMNDQAQSALAVIIFVVIAVIFALIAIWGFINLNIWAIVIGVIGEIAWFFIFWLALR
jgi:hypothetical protein